MRRRTRSSDSKTVRVIEALLITAVEVFFGAYWLMLTIGAAHSQAAVIPTLPYAACMWLVVAVRAVPVVLTTATQKETAKEVENRRLGRS